MIIKGGAFDKIRDERLIAELCGATRLWEENGERFITFKSLNTDYPPRGLLQHEGIKERAAKDGEMRAFAANECRGEENSEVPQGIQRVVEDRNEVRFKSFQAGAQSSGSLVPTASTPDNGIVIRGKDCAH